MDCAESGDAGKGRNIHEQCAATTSHKYINFLRPAPTSAAIAKPVAGRTPSAHPLSKIRPLLIPPKYRERMSAHSPDIQSILDQLDAADRDAHALIQGLAEQHGLRPPEPGSWSVAQCLEHLALTSHAYLDAMESAAARARARSRLRRGPAKPGWLAAKFIATLEPPAKRRIKAPPKIHPRTAPPLAEAHAQFSESQRRIRSFLLTHADLDLASIRFRNPFIPVVAFSLASGLHVLVAHDRRHLWQAWNARNAAQAEPQLPTAADTARNR